MHSMPYLTTVAAILLALLAGIVSPGPAFIQVARVAVSQSRADGLAAALGLGLGAMIIAALAMGGLQSLLKAVPWLYTLLKIVGGLYLLGLAWKIWRHADQPLTTLNAASVDSADESMFAHAHNLPVSFRQGLFTQLSNPKCAIYYGSIFAALLPEHFPFAASLLVMLGALVLESSWYAVVALVLSTSAPRAAYLRSKGKLDRIAATVMGALGIRLLVTAP